jgi:shikimate kinase/3-dehydroquinate synthase
MALERSLLLSGMMATGKSTVGRLAAAKAGVPFVDLDAAIEAESGQSVADLFATRGEPAFRAIEAEVLRRLLADGVVRVVALGGGALVPRALRHEALERATVVTLEAPLEALLERARPYETRPLLASGDPHATLARLLDLRAEAYAEAHATLQTSGRDVDTLADAALAVAERAPIAMPLGRRSYAIDVVVDDPARLTDALAGLAPSKLVIVSDANVDRARGASLKSVRRALAIPAIDVVLPAGEEHKNLGAVATIWDAALGSGVDRDAVVVAFGGGVVGDLAGFAAATLLRGVRFVQVPTTLLAMVDSSVGGKTGFDSTAGKNLIGAFHQPSAVIADMAHLSTLAPRQRTAGLAEVVKVALCTDAPLFTFCEEQAAAIVAGDAAVTREVVRRSVAAKARVVRDDEHEQGARALLNAGHTAGHGLETAGGYAKWLHGEAVAAGLVWELRWLATRGLADLGLAERTERLLARLGLTVPVAGAEWAAAAAFVGADKKRRGRSVGLPTVKTLGEGTIARVPMADFEAGLRGG